MKTYLFKTTLIAFGLLLSSCLCSKGVDYKESGHWQIRFYNENYADKYPYLHHPNPFTKHNRIFDSADDQSLRLAQDYGIKLESAEMIIALAHGSQVEKNLKALQLEVSDVAPLANLERLPTASVEKMAQALGESTDTMTTLFEDFIADTRLQ